MVGCTRESLHIISSEKGVVIGDLVLQIGGKEINCAPDQQRISASTEKKKVECKICLVDREEDRARYAGTN